MTESVPAPARKTDHAIDQTGLSNRRGGAYLGAAKIAKIATADSLERLQNGPAPAIEEKKASDEAYSTFSLHVSDVSFKLAQAALAAGQWPESAKIRVEEFVNALDYGDPAPAQEEKVACQIEQAAHPFMQQRNLVRVSMRTAALGRAAGTPLRLTILLDNSGSMERRDRVESVRKAFRLLAAQLKPQDQVTLIGFARQPRLLADRVDGEKAEELVQLVESLPSEGGTNLEQALELGLAKALEQYHEDAQNRLILITDGAANLGNAKPMDLAGMVLRMRRRGIAFDACGVGIEGLNDDILEALTRSGTGVTTCWIAPRTPTPGLPGRSPGAAARRPQREGAGGVQPGEGRALSAAGI